MRQIPSGSFMLMDQALAAVAVDVAAFSNVEGHEGRQLTLELIQQFARQLRENPQPLEEWEQKPIPYEPWTEYPELYAELGPSIAKRRVLLLAECLRMYSCWACEDLRYPLLLARGVKRLIEERYLQRIDELTAEAGSLELKLLFRCWASEGYKTMVEAELRKRHATGKWHVTPKQDSNLVSLWERSHHPYLPQDIEIANPFEQIDLPAPYGDEKMTCWVTADSAAAFCREMRELHEKRTTELQEQANELVRKAAKLIEVIDVRASRVRDLENLAQQYDQRITTDPVAE